MELYERAGGVGSSRVLNEHQPAQPVQSSQRASGERIGGSNFHQRASEQQQRAAAAAAAERTPHLSAVRDRQLCPIRRGVGAGTDG